MAGNHFFTILFFFQKMLKSRFVWWYCDPVKAVSLSSFGFIHCYSSSCFNRKGVGGILSFVEDCRASKNWPTSLLEEYNGSPWLSLYLEVE